MAGGVCGRPRHYRLGLSRAKHLAPFVHDQPNLVQLAESAHLARRALDSMQIHAIVAHSHVLLFLCVERQAAPANLGRYERGLFWKFQVEEELARTERDALVQRVCRREIVKGVLP